MTTKKSTRMSVIFWASLMAIGWLDHVFSRAPAAAPYHFASILAISVLFFAWFMADASDLGVAPSRALKVSVLAVAVLAIPYYLLRYKGLKRSLMSMVKFAGFLSVYMVSQVALAHLLTGKA